MNVTMLKPIIINEIMKKVPNKFALTQHIEEEVIENYPSPNR
jgi:hypothetical protein